MSLLLDELQASLTQTPTKTVEARHARYPGGPDERAQEQALADQNILYELFARGDDLEAIEAYTARGVVLDPEAAEGLAPLVYGRRWADLMVLWLRQPLPAQQFIDTLFPDRHPWLMACEDGRLDLLELLWQKWPSSSEWLVGFTAQAADDSGYSMDRFVVPALRWWIDKGLPLPRNNKNDESTWLEWFEEAPEAGALEILQGIAQQWQPSSSHVRELWERCVDDDHLAHLDALIAVGWLPHQMKPMLFRVLEEGAIHCLERLLDAPRMKAVLRRAWAKRPVVRAKELPPATDPWVRVLQRLPLTRGGTRVAQRLHEEGIDWGQLSWSRAPFNLMRATLAPAKLSCDALYPEELAEWMNWGHAHYPQLCGPTLRRQLSTAPEDYRAHTLAVWESWQLTQSLAPQSPSTTAALRPRL